MIIFPAIDIKDGKVVRLRRGKFDEVTVYSENPIEVAQKWEAAGAQWLHVVDLDGAQTGVMKNFEIVRSMAQTLRIPIQMGGGIREKANIDRLFSAGVQRVVLGTKAIENRSFLKKILEKWHSRIILSLDCSNGMVALKGWTEVSELKAVDVARDLKTMGVAAIVYTDISRDGMLTGPNIPAMQNLLREVGIPIIASGGVATIEDIQALKKLEPRGLIGVITGKAIYEGRLDLKEAIRLCSPKG